MRRAGWPRWFLRPPRLPGIWSHARLPPRLWADPLGQAATL